MPQSSINNFILFYFMHAFKEQYEKIITAGDARQVFVGGVNDTNQAGDGAQ